MILNWIASSTPLPNASNMPSYHQVSASLMECSTEYPLTSHRSILSADVVWPRAKILILPGFWFRPISPEPRVPLGALLELSFPVATAGVRRKACRMAGSSRFSKLPTGRRSLVLVSNIAAQQQDNSSHLR